MLRVLDSSRLVGLCCKIKEILVFFRDEVSYDVIYMQIDAARCKKCLQHSDQVE